jgi:hypothetical protein
MYTWKCNVYISYIMLFLYLLQYIFRLIITLLSYTYIIQSKQVHVVDFMFEYILRLSMWIKCLFLFSWCVYNNMSRMNSHKHIHTIIIHPYNILKHDFYMYFIMFASTSLYFIITISNIDIIKNCMGILEVIKVLIKELEFL